MSALSGERQAPPKPSPFYDPKLRSLATQLLLCLAVAALVYFAVTNAAENLERARVASGFAFWNYVAGFDISQTLIDYAADRSTYGRAFWVGLINTLLVSSLGVVFATLLGFLVGIARLSRNLLVSRIATGYVELIRNVPLLLQLLFWYNAVLKSLPELRESLALGNAVFLNNRGFFLPQPRFGEGMWLVPAAAAVGIAGAVALRFWARRRQERTGQQFPLFLPSIVLVVGPPAIALLAIGAPISFSFPEKGRFNIRGGVEILPEFVALLFGLVVYTAGFIAEVVRAGILSVSRGQTEAAYALGLRSGPTLRIVVIPQAMRVIIPPLTTQYLNLLKNSSLAVAIGYPDLVQVFTGTVLNQTGQAVEVVAITMAVYLVISLLTSFAMNWYNSRKAIVER